MALERMDIRLAIDKSVFDALPLDKKLAFRDSVRWLKSHSVKINAGLPNEEDTTIAQRQICNHDTGGSCEPWREI